MVTKLSTVIVNLLTGVLTLQTPFVTKTYPVVVPRQESLAHYGGRRRFSVQQIGLNVAWKDSRGRIIPANSPHNPLGAGRIRFSNYTRPCSIHGNAKHAHLGQPLSGCCIRMLDKDFLELVFEIDNSTEIRIID